MFSQSVTSITDDPALPALAQVLNTEQMPPVLAQVAGLHLNDGKGLSCTADVLNHKLGQRCTIRYTLTRTSELGQPINLVTVVGKVYGRQELAERLYRRTKDLRSGAFNSGGPLRIPAPIMLLQDLGLVLQEYVDGADLRHVLSAGKSDGPLSLAGHWLARLHTVSPLAGLKTKSLEHELGKIDRWCEYIAPCLGTTDAGGLRAAQETLHRFGGEIPPCESVMIHRDFYYANVLWAAQRVWVLDFDELSIGDPALDVGHFLAHLENLAYRITGRVDAFAQATPPFLRSYQERASFDLEARLPFYRAYTFLKLAATEVSRKRGDWERMAQVLTGQARREVA